MTSRHIKFIGGHQSRTCHLIEDQHSHQEFVDPSSLSKVMPLSSESVAVRPTMQVELYQRREFYSRHQRYEFFVLAGLTARDVSSVLGFEVTEQ